MTRTDRGCPMTCLRDFGRAFDNTIYRCVSLWRVHETQQQLTGCPSCLSTTPSWYKCNTLTLLWQSKKSISKTRCSFYLSAIFLSIATYNTACKSVLWFNMLPYVIIFLPYILFECFVLFTIAVTSQMPLWAVITAVIYLLSQSHHRLFLFHPGYLLPWKRLLYME